MASTPWTARRHSAYTVRSPWSQGNAANSASGGCRDIRTRLCRSRKARMTKGANWPLAPVTSTFIASSPVLHTVVSTSTIVSTSATGGCTNLLPLWHIVQQVCTRCKLLCYIACNRLLATLRGALPPMTTSARIMVTVFHDDKPPDQLPGLSRQESTEDVKRLV